MKSHARFFLHCLCVLTLGCMLLASQMLFANPLIETLSQIPLPNYVPPKVYEHTYASGDKVDYVQDASLPVYEISAFFHTGALEDPIEQWGLTELFAKLWQSAGTTALDPDAHALALENYGAELSVKEGLEFIEVKLQTLDKYKAQTLPLFFDVLLHPRFDAQVFLMLKQKMLARIAMQNEKASAVANREFLQMLFGNAHPLAQTETPASLDALNQDSMQQYYETRIATKPLQIVAKGPMPLQGFLQLCDPWFVQWQEAAQGKAKSQEILAAPSHSVPTLVASAQWIDFKGTQAVVILGHASVDRLHPDKFKIMLVNAVLGGSMASKLGKRIRTELGLAYSVSSEVNFSRDTGVFTMSVVTANENVEDVIFEMRRIFTEVINEQTISAQEWQDVKTQLLNQFVFQFDQSFAVAKAHFFYEAYGYPKDYLQTYFATIQNMPLDDLTRVLQTHFHPEALQVLVVGDKSKIKNQAFFKKFTQRSLEEKP